MEPNTGLKIYRVNEHLWRVEMSQESRGQCNHWQFSDHMDPHFLFPVPIDRSSKLFSGSSRLPLVPAAREKDDLDSRPGWTLWVVDRRLLLETSRLERLSLGSPEELGLLLVMKGLFEELPFREELRALSESGCCKDWVLDKKKCFRSQNFNL